MEGNLMKMREAVEAALTELDKFGQCHDDRIHFADIVHIGRARGMLQDALSAPPRQCDVGTAEDQYQRYEKFCCNHYRIADNGSGNCLKCPFSQPVCKLSWAQTPYAEKGGAE